MKRLRILFLAGRDPGHPKAGGGDIQAWAWARWAAEQGHAVTYICQSSTGLPDADTRYGVRLRRLGSGFWLSWRAWRFYKRRHHEYDLIYEDPIGADRIPYFSPVYSRVPVIAVWHQVTAGLLSTLYSRPIAGLGSILERVLARIYRRCQMWTPSVESADELVGRLGFRRSRLHVIPPTIPSETITLDVSTRRTKTIVFLGVIRRYKSVEHAIIALERVIKVVPSAMLVVAGRVVDDVYLSELVALVERLGLTAHVVMRPNVSEDEKLGLLREARVLVLPSVLEGFGIVTLEANAVGTPVIASTGVPAAAVDHGVSGFRYEYGEVDQLVTHIVSILTNDELFKEMETTAQRHSTRFTPDSVGASFNRLLDAALGASDA